MYYIQLLKRINTMNRTLMISIMTESFQTVENQGIVLAGEEEIIRQRGL
jgi:hypothetical protein